MTYQILREISEWKGNFKCNHTYLIDNDKIIAYIRQGDSKVITLKHSLTMDKRYRKFIKVDNVDLNKLIPKTKNSIIRTFNIQSKDKSYIVELDTIKNRYRCTCPGFTFRGKCKHIETVKQQ